MKKLSQKILVGVLILAFVISIGVSASTPGNSDDPLISKSYVDSTLIPYVNSVSTFSVVNLSANRHLIGLAGCEIILRSGTATVISTEKGGVCDVTSGVDLTYGAVVPANHNLIVPVSDGRGIKSETDLILMIKGNYEIY
ncbi:MAG: hypothetical protein ACI3XA_03655 [Clostridia bacterium]